MKASKPLFLLLFSPILSFALAPLYFALGLEKAEEIKAYKEWGFNAVWVDLSPDDFSSAKDALVGEALKEGLIPVICLRLDSPKLGSRRPLDETYKQNTFNWAREIVEKYKDQAQIVWAVGYDPTSAVNYNEEDFLHYLLTWYGSFPGISSAWGTQVQFPRDVTFQLVDKLSQDKEGQAPLYGISKASLDLALYKWGAVKDLLNMWLSAIRGMDQKHPVITGMLKDYKSIVCVPHGYDGITVALYPTEVERDLFAHNPQATAMARRGGLFASIPVFLLDSSEHYKVDAPLLERWLNIAYIQGATGAGFDNWNYLKSHPELKEKIKGIVSRQPLPLQNRIGVLYEPFLEGYNLGGRGLYGFLSTPLLNQPSDLFFALRLGTRYGGVDFLSLEDLSRLDIAKYKVILAPSAFFLSQEAREALQLFLLMGGILVADIGFDCYHAGGSLLSLSDFVKTNFGLEGFFTLTKGQGNISITMEHPLFPALKKQTKSDGNKDGYAVDGCLGFTYVGTKTDTLAVVGVLLGSGGRSAIAGITVKKVGLGWAIYATFPLWRNWLPYNKLFNEFHDPVFAWGNLGYIEENLFPFTVIFALLKDGYAVANLAQYVLIASLFKSENSLFISCFTLPQEGGGFRILIPLNQGEAKVLKPLPIKVDPPDLIVQVKEYDENKVRLKIWGKGSTPYVKDKELEAVPVLTTLGSVTIGEGLYKVGDKLNHHVSVTNAKTGEKKEFIVKSEGGVLVLQGSFWCDEIEITPERR